MKSARTPTNLGRGDGAAVSALGLSRAVDVRSRTSIASTVYLGLRRLGLALSTPARIMVRASRGVPRVAAHLRITPGTSNPVAPTGPESPHAIQNESPQINRDEAFTSPIAQR